MIYRVYVGVALECPIKALPDEFRNILVEANSPTEAELIACQVAACTSVMPTWSRLVPGKLVSR